jgi:hypothetical protein
MISPWGMRGKGIGFADRPVVPVPRPCEPMDRLPRYATLRFRKAHGSLGTGWGDNCSPRPHSALIPNSLMSGHISRHRPFAMRRAPRASVARVGKSPLRDRRDAIAQPDRPTPARRPHRNDYVTGSIPSGRSALSIDASTRPGASPWSSGRCVRGGFSPSVW